MNEGGIAEPAPKLSLQGTYRDEILRSSRVNVRFGGNQRQQCRGPIGDDDGLLDPQVAGDFTANDPRPRVTAPKISKA